VRQNLESFLAYTRQHYDGGLPRYVESELRAYLKCGLLSEGFTRARCDVCGHDLLVPFRVIIAYRVSELLGQTHGQRGGGHRRIGFFPMCLCASMSSTLPYELRKLAAFKADVLTALGRIFVDAVFTSYGQAPNVTESRYGQCGAIISFSASAA